jgi:DNA-binding Xre family transcriptional regulator
LIKYNLEKAINELDITPNRLAVLAEVRPNTVGDLIKGNTKRIELETIEKILDALNYESTRKNKKYYQIQDIVQYENESIPKPDFNGIITKEDFETLRRIFKNTPISTSIPGYNTERENVLKIVFICADDLLGDKNFWLPVRDLTPKEQAFFDIRHHLAEHQLADIIHNASVIKVILTEKGKEFVNLIKKYGTS